MFTLACYTHYTNEYFNFKLNFVVINLQIVSNQIKCILTFLIRSILHPKRDAKIQIINYSYKSKYLQFNPQKKTELYSKNR